MATFLPVFVSARLRRHPAFLEGLVGDGAFDGLDGDRVVVDVERAGGLARRRAHAPRHLREVVGRVQVERRRLPLVAVDQVVPVRDLVVHRAAVVAVGDAAVHAARGLLLHLLLGQRLDELAPMLHALVHRAGSARSWRSNSMKPVILPIVSPSAASAGSCRILTKPAHGYTLSSCISGRLSCKSPNGETASPCDCLPARRRGARLERG